MTNSPCKIIAEYLRSQDVFSDPADSETWPLYLTRLPDGRGATAEAGAVTDTPGIKDGREMGTGTILFHYGLQIRLRARSYSSGWVKAQEVETLLSSIANEAISVGSESYTLHNISQTSSIMYMGTEDGSDRLHLFSINFLCTITEED